METKHRKVVDLPVGNDKKSIPLPSKRELLWFFSGSVFTAAFGLLIKKLTGKPPQEHPRPYPLNEGMPFRDISFVVHQGKDRSE